MSTYFTMNEQCNVHQHKSCFINDLLLLEPPPPALNPHVNAMQNAKILVLSMPFKKFPRRDLHLSSKLILNIRNGRTGE